jgi:hypothetical protein
METMTLVCGHVFRNERDVKLVIRHSDGGWQLVCGQHDHPEDCADFEVVCLEHLAERQSTLSTLGAVKPGWLAEWTGNVWELIAHDD